MSYQDRWVKGAIRERGLMACKVRYRLIKEHALSRFARPFTLLDLGANAGYFGLRAAYEFPGSVSVMIDRDEELELACRSNDLPGTIAMRQRLTGEDISELATCERFDVVLALNILHWIHDWEIALPSLLELGDVVIVQTPKPGNHSMYANRFGPILRELRALGFAKLADTPAWKPGETRPMFLWRRDGNPRPLRTSYLDCRSDIRPHRIASTESNRKIIFNDGESREWIPGINLRTFLLRGGVYPSRERLRGMVEEEAARWSDHGDIHLGNFILQGDRVRLIDSKEPRSFKGDGWALERTMAMLKRPAEEIKGAVW